MPLCTKSSSQATWLQPRPQYTTKSWQQKDISVPQMPSACVRTSLLYDKLHPGGCGATPQCLLREDREGLRIVVDGVEGKISKQLSHAILQLLLVRMR